MSGRKKDQNKKDFANNPFKTLKGLSVSDVTVSPESKQEIHHLRAADPQDVSFERAMEDLGVSPMDPASSPDDRPVVSCPSQVKKDDDLFLEAFSEMDAVFKDNYPQEEELPPTPSRMKLLRQGKLYPEARLDLHGLNRDEARQKVRFLLEDAVYQGTEVVLIITGKGKGSENGPVLRDEIEKYLRLEASAWVVEWGRAPGNLGGEGALVVFVRHKKSPQS